MKARGVPWVCGLWAAAAVFWLSVSEASAARRALVIGNGNYQFAGPLKNPQNDADLMETALRALGFAVTKHKDLTALQMKAAVRAFRGELSEGDTAVVYFSGHGLQFKGENLLVPVDFNAKYEYEVTEAAVSLNNVVDALGGAHAKPKLVFLDCCRDAPNFAPAVTRSIARGLAEVKTPDDETLVCFATKHGAVAFDNPDQSNSYYTKALASEIARPGRKVEEIMKEVTRSVRSASNGTQIPYTYGNLTDDFYFAGGNSGLSGAHASDSVNSQILQQMAELRLQMERLQRPAAPPERPTLSPVENNSLSSRPPTAEREVQGESEMPSGFKTFFQRMWEHQASNDASDWASDFASSVDYCYKSNGAASRSFIQNDRAKLLTRYPSRDMKLGTVENVQVMSPTEVKVTYTFHYEYRGKSRASGRARVNLTAKSTGDRWLITRFDESVIRN